MVWGCREEPWMRSHSRRKISRMIIMVSEAVGLWTYLNLLSTILISTEVLLLIALLVIVVASSLLLGNSLDITPKEIPSLHFVGLIIGL